jgi:hypothetical protein
MGRTSEDVISARVTSNMMTQIQECKTLLNWPKMPTNRLIIWAIRALWEDLQNIDKSKKEKEVQCKAINTLAEQK